MKSILDPTFKYTSSAATDLRKTFARVQRELKAAAQVADGQASTQKVLTDNALASGETGSSVLAAPIKLADRRQK